jgi:hypothetical protein
MRGRPGHPDAGVAPVDAMSPPSSVRRTERPVRPRRAAATATAQEEEPEASVMPVPRSQTRMRRWSGREARELHIGAFGEERVVLRSPRRARRGPRPRRRPRRRCNAGCPWRWRPGRRRWAGAGCRRPPQRDVGPVGQGLAHVDEVRPSPASRACRMPRSVRIVRATTGRAPPSRGGDAARGVAAGRREGPVGVVEDQPGRPASGSITASWSKPTPR